MLPVEITPSALRAKLSEQGVKVSVQAVWAWSKGGGIRPNLLATVANVCGLSAREAAQFYAGQGVPLPASILALLPPAPQAAS